MPSRKNAMTSIKPKVEKMEPAEIKTKIKTEPKDRKEKEDGEVSSDDSKESSPLCQHNEKKFVPRDKKFTKLANVDMFESQKLPLFEKPPPPIPWSINYRYSRRDQPYDSFDRKLQELKQVMRSAGYKLGQRNIKFVKPNSALELNDLDTDPYYTNKPPVSARLHKTPEKLCIPFMLNENRTVRFQYPISESSSSSSDDFTSTTDSSSSSSASPAPRRCYCKHKFSTSTRSKVKHQHRLRRRRLLSSSSSNSDTYHNYSSETHSSELSSSSREDFAASRNRKFRFKPKRNKTNRLNRRKREHLQRKLQKVNEMIARLKKRRI